MINWKDIITRCERGESAAQEQLYRQCYPLMLKVCLRYARDLDEAGALYNEGMFKVFSNIHQYKGKGEFEAWVRRIIVNSCIDHTRKQAKFSHQVLDEDTQVNGTISPEAYEKISGDEIIRMIQYLPRNTALVFNLFVLEGYKHEEIAKMIGISAGTSKWHMNEARRLLKAQLEILLKKETYSNAI